jgi:hypothetical protein
VSSDREQAGTIIRGGYHSRVTGKHRECPEFDMIRYPFFGAIAILDNAPNRHLFQNIQQPACVIVVFMTNDQMLNVSSTSAP